MGPKVRLFLGMVIFLLAALFLYYEMGLQVSPSVMTGALMRAFSVEAVGLSMLSSIYFYSYALMQIPAGLLFDRMSKRLLLVVAIGVCALGAFFFAMSSLFGWAALGRFFMGFGSAFAFIGVLVVAARWFPPRFFAFLVGLAQFLAALGAMTGVVAISYAVDTFGWRETIRVLGWCGVGLALLTLLIVREHPEHKLLRKEGGLSIGGSLRAVLSEGQNWLIGLYAFCLWGPMALFASLWGVPFLMRAYGIAGTEAAWAISMMWVGIALCSPCIGWLSDKLGRRLSLMRALSFLGFFAALALLYLPVPLWAAYLLTFCLGIACSAQILTFAMIKDRNRVHVTATAIGFNNMAVVLGGAILQPLVGWFLEMGWDGTSVNGVAVYSAGTFRFALVLVPLLYLIGFLCSRFLLKETYGTR